MVQIRRGSHLLRPSAILDLRLQPGGGPATLKEAWQSSLAQGRAGVRMLKPAHDFD